MGQCVRRRALGVEWSEYDVAHRHDQLQCDARCAVCRGAVGDSMLRRIGASESPSGQEYYLDALDRRDLRGLVVGRCDVDPLGLANLADAGAVEDDCSPVVWMGMVMGSYYFSNLLMVLINEYRW